MGTGTSKKSKIKEIKKSNLTFNEGTQPIDLLDNAKVEYNNNKTQKYYPKNFSPIKQRNKKDCMTFVTSKNSKNNYKNSNEIIIINNVNKIPNELLSKKKCKFCNLNYIPIRFICSHLYYCRECYNKKKKQTYQWDLESTDEPEISEILPGKLYLGNVEGAYNKNLLLKYKITSILVCGYFLNEYFPNDFNYLTLEFEDNEYENLMLSIPKGIEFISKNKCTYVHCKKGISRSSSIVISYLMFQYKKTYEQAYNFVLEQKNNIKPNQNFVKQLQDFFDLSKLFNYDINMLKDFSSTLINNKSEDIKNNDNKNEDIDEL